jgi:hypothetical protein
MNFGSILFGGTIMDELKESIRAIFRSVSLNTPQLGLADLEEIEKRVLNLLKNKVVVDKRKLEKLMEEFPTANRANCQVKRKFQKFFGLTEKLPLKNYRKLFEIS